MESDYTEYSQGEEKYLYDVNKSNNNLEYNYCPHILHHFLNPFINSTFEKINVSSNYSNPTHENKADKDKNKTIYTRNLSMFQNNLKYYNYLGYRQIRNLFDSFLLNNFSLDYILINNPQNLSINSMIRDGCLFSLNFNDTGNLMISSNQENTMEIWDMKTRKIKQIIKAHNEIVTDTQFFHNELDNQFFLSCSLDRTIRLWNNFKSIHTFIEHNDWVRCINIREDNNQFLSGCVSSVVKLWDIPTQRVIASVKNINDDPNVLSTVNTLSFLHENKNLFLIGLRSGEIKLFDTRIKNKNNDNIQNMGIVHSFKAHYKKLNNFILNNSDKYLFTSSRDSLIRLWDFRKLPGEKETEEEIKKNNKFIYEYNKHKCVGYNIGCSFYNNEQYIITGSENYFLYIYDILNPNNYYKIKTQQKCINFVKQIPNTYDICFTGLEDVSIFVWNAHKNIIKYYQNKNKEIENNTKNNEITGEDSDGERYIDEIEETDKNRFLCNKLIEEIMEEFGDVILKIFHKQNLTYSRGINFENLMEIIRGSNDTESENILNKINQKFMEKIINNFISGYKNENKKEDIKIDHIKENIIKKREIKCLECQKKDNKEIKMDNNDKNIFNSVDKEELYNLLNLPNKYGFYEKKENEINFQKSLNMIDYGKNFINKI